MAKREKDVNGKKKTAEKVKPRGPLSPEPDLIPGTEAGEAIPEKK